MYANNDNPGQTLCSTASGLGLECLPISHEKDTKLIFVDHSGIDEGLSIIAYHLNMTILVDWDFKHQNNRVKIMISLKKIHI